MRKICERSKKIWRNWLLKDLEKLAAGRQREEEKTDTDDLVNTPNHTVHGRPYITSVDSRHVSDGDWGILSVYPTYQTDGSVSRWCSTCCVYSAKMRICHPISEHIQSGAALYQRWTWSQRTRRSIGSNVANGEGGAVGSCNRCQHGVVSRMEHSCLWQHVTDARHAVPYM